MSREIATLSAQNTFTSWIAPTRKGSTGFDSEGFLNLIISGTWAGTITVQKRHQTGAATYTDPFDLPTTFTANTVKLIEDHSTTVQYRIGFKTGEYTSGSALVRLEQ